MHNDRSDIVTLSLVSRKRTFQCKVYAEHIEHFIEAEYLIQKRCLTQTLISRLPMVLHFEAGFTLQPRSPQTNSHVW
jgi:hypothetical protein